MSVCGVLDKELIAESMRAVRAMRWRALPIVLVLLHRAHVFCVLLSPALAAFPPMPVVQSLTLLPPAGEFFVAMDTNHDGTVDFNEFLVAMTSQSSEDSTTNKLKEAFFEFANHHRRQKILDFVNSSTPSDIEKYHSMKELFKIQYFKEEQLDLSTAEKLQRVQAVAAKQMKEIRTKEYLEQRKVEQIRSREALLYFNDARRTGPPTICCDTIPHLLDTEVTESEVAMKKAEKEIRNKFAGFSLHMEKTFTSEGMVTKGMQSAPPPEPVRMRAKTEALKAKSDKFLMKNLPPILPPVSVKARASTLTPA